MSQPPNTSTPCLIPRRTFRPGPLAAGSALFVALALGPVAPAIAQGPPPKSDCDTLPQADDMSKAEKVNARVNCRTERVNVELVELVEQARNSDMFSPTAKRTLENARDHAHRARERARQAGSFKGLGRKQNNDCYLQEADPALAGHEGNGDGVCTTRGGMKETCAEVIGDGVGDDDGICRTMGNRKEVCVEVCDSPLNDQDDDNFDEATATDVETAFTDLESALVDANQEMSAAVKAHAEARLLSQILPAADSACLQVGPWSTLVTAALVQSKTVAEYAFDLCSSLCGNDIAGFNCYATCSVPATAKAILGILVNLSDQLEEVANRSGYEIQYSCQGTTSNAVAQVDSAVAVVDTKATNTEAKVQDIDRKVDDLNVKAGNTDGKVDEIQRKVDVLNGRIDEVMKLLNTPQGRRPDFPKP